MHKLVSLALAALVSTFLAAAPALAEPQAGKDYKAVSPPLATPKGKIEVVEFFSYGCPHCNDFHPLISQWAAKLPKDITFRRVPVSFNRPEWARLSRIYFALESIGELTKLDAAVFIAIHEQRIAFKNDDAVFAWVTTKGIDGKKFAEAYNSFSMASRIQRADQEATAARIGGVPAIVVDGRYLVNNEAVSSFDQLLKLTDAIIDKARQENKGK